MQRITKIAIVALALAVGTNGCSNDDEQQNCENGAFSLLLNGESVTALGVNNTMLKGSSSGAAGKRIDIRATDAEGRQYIVTFTDLTNGTSGNCVTTDDYIPFSEVTTGTENVFMFTVIENGVSDHYEDGFLDVTNCDESKRQVSGTFSFGDSEYNVSNGAFTNMCYDIIQ
jgi:hypothetical protein